MTSPRCTVLGEDAEVVFVTRAKLGEHLRLLRAGVRAAGGARAHVEENLGGGGGGVESLGELSDGCAAGGDGGLDVSDERDPGSRRGRPAEAGAREGARRRRRGSPCRGTPCRGAEACVLRAGVHGRGTARCEAGGRGVSATDPCRQRGERRTHELCEEDGERAGRGVGGAVVIRREMGPYPRTTCIRRTRRRRGRGGCRPARQPASAAGWARGKRLVRVGYARRE